MGSISDEIISIPETLPHWQLFAHDSDIGIRGIGYTLIQSFEQAGIALTGMVTDPHSVESKKNIHITCSAPEIELLFMDWINAIIYEMSLQKMLFHHYDLQLNDLCLRATLWREPVDVKRHMPAVEPKAATFSELKVFKLPEEIWISQCVVDV